MFDFADVIVHRTHPHVISYPCLKTGDVTKGPYLLEVPTSDFGLISLEIGNKRATNIDITT